MAKFKAIIGFFFFMLYIYIMWTLLGIIKNYKIYTHSYADVCDFCINLCCKIIQYNSMNLAFTILAWLGVLFGYIYI